MDPRAKDYSVEAAITTNNTSNSVPQNKKVKIPEALEPSHMSLFMPNGRVSAIKACMFFDSGEELNHISLEYRRKTKLTPRKNTSLPQRP